MSILTFSNGMTHTFLDDGTHTFSFTILDGSSHDIDAEVTWIDDRTPTATINVCPRLTNQDVTVRLTDVITPVTTKVMDYAGDGILARPSGQPTTPYDPDPALSDGRDVTVTFTGNGVGTFSLHNRTGTNTVDVVVDCIDKIPPTADVIYDITTPTAGNVTATLVNESEAFTILNNN